MTQKLKTKNKNSIIEINKTCSVCGKYMRILMEGDKILSGGHYFGEVKVPIPDKGEYVATGYNKDLGCKVCKWLGEEIEMEYWECEECFKKGEEDELGE